MHFSKILIKSLALCLSTCSIAAADSPQLSRALDDLSTLSEGIQLATNSINFYQGGALPAIPAGKKFYNVWNTLQKATAGLGNESDLSPEDSRELIDEVENMRPIVQKGMEASGSKLPTLDKAGVGFISLALHEGVKRDLKKYLSVMRSSLPEDQQSRVDDLSSFYDEVHNAAFGA